MTAAGDMLVIVSGLLAESLALLKSRLPPPLPNPSPIFYPAGGLAKQRNPKNGPRNVRCDDTCRRGWCLRACRRHRLCCDLLQPRGRRNRRPWHRCLGCRLAQPPHSPHRYLVWRCFHHRWPGRSHGDVRWTRYDSKFFLPFGATMNAAGSFALIVSLHR